MTSKKDTKIDKSKLEGLKVVGGKDGYNLAKKKKIKDVIYTSPVKIGDKEYIIKPLSMYEIKHLNIERKKLKEDDETAKFDFSFHTLLVVIQKFNPGTETLTTDDLEKAINIVEFERIQEAILQISGLKKFFRPGVSKE